MSFVTGTQAELLAANTANGSSFATFTSAQFIGAGTGAGYLPANFFLPNLGIGKSLLVKAYGIIGTTSGTQNFTMAVTANTTQGQYNSGGIFATTAATTITASSTNLPWELEVLITCSATGSSGTFLADGMWKVYPTGSSLINARCSSSAANPNTALTLSTESAYYVELAGTWNNSNGSNAVQVYNVAVFGLN